MINLDVYRYFLYFVFYSFIGWAYESIYYTLRRKKPVNTGFLNICLCPIYGIGALLDIGLLSRVESVWQLFIAGILICCTLEYIASWLLEEIFHTRWWDYSEWRFNINGRVCLLGAFAFGTLSVLLIKFIHPMVMIYINNISPSVIKCLCIIALLLLFGDIISTIRNPEKFEEKLWFINPKQ